MSQDELFESWKRSRAEPQASADFTARVMTAIRNDAAKSRRLSLARLVLARMLASRTGRFAVFCLATGACVLRIASLFSFLLVR